MTLTYIFPPKYLTFKHKYPNETFQVIFFDITIIKYYCLLCRKHYNSNCFSYKVDKL